SLGGESALVAVERDMAAQYFAERFRAAIVYYPNCVIPAPSMTAPTLILIGEAGRRIGARCCRERHGCAIFRRTVSRRNRLLPGPDKPASRKCGQYQTGGDIAHSVGYRYAELPSTCLLLCD